MSAEKLACSTNTEKEAHEENDLANANAEINISNGDSGEPASKASSSAVQVITRFMCKFCGMQFIRRPDMDAHASLHDDEKPPLTCGVCGKVYNTRSKLQRHVRVHSGERPFPCVVCGKRFPRSDHVKQHMRVHTKLPGELSTTPAPLGLTHKSYCRLCGVKFEQKSELSEHLLTHGFNKLFSCIYCGEVFESNEKLKVHRQTHETHFDEFLPVLSVPDPSMSSKSGLSLPRNGSKRKKVGRPKGAATKRRREMSRLGFSKFKITRRSSSESWQTVGPILKSEETASPAKSDTTGDKSMPILERILMEKERSIVKSEEETEESGSSDVPQMSISACYSLAEGQDNSDIPDIDEIRASTLSDGSNMIVLPMGEGLGEGGGDNDPDPEGDETGLDEATDAGPTDLSHSAAVCAVTGSRNDSEGEGRSTQASFIRPTVLPATATATLMTLQQQVYPQIASAAASTTTVTAATTMTPAAASTNVATRPTISLLPNVLAFRTHPILTTPALNLAPTAVHPTASASIYNPANHLYNYNTLGTFPVASSALQRGLNLPSETFPLGRKMMRCQYCCIWFEDSALGLLHQSLHSADETDPFTCKKCLKRLGNRLEFTAHIIWHLDPTMEESAVA